MQFYHQTAASTAPMPEDLSFANQPYLMSLDSCNDTLYSWLVQWRLESLQVQLHMRRETHCCWSFRSRNFRTGGDPQAQFMALLFATFNHLTSHAEAERQYAELYSQRGSEHGVHQDFKFAQQYIR